MYVYEMSDWKTYTGHLE